MHRLSVVIPALNEESNIPATLSAVPVDRLRRAGYEVELLVVDNGSMDRTAQVAREHGARVLIQPVRGYGNAYKCGFANSTGEIIATGDADQTYPFEILPDVLAQMKREDLEFVSTNRLAHLRPEAMKASHKWANLLLTGVSRALYENLPFRDSQSGMWIFKRYVWSYCEVQSGGMPFSQEIKVEAFRKGFRCAEIPIEYRPRVGETKLRGLRDGALVAGHLLAHRMRPSRPGPMEVFAGVDDRVRALPIDRSLATADSMSMGGDRCA